MACAKASQRGLLSGGTIGLSSIVAITIAVRGDWITDERAMAALDEHAASPTATHRIRPCGRLVPRRLAPDRLRIADVTHHLIPPKHDQGMHRAPTEPSRNHNDSLPLIVPF